MTDLDVHEYGDIWWDGYGKATAEAKATLRAIAKWLLDFDYPDGFTFDVEPPQPLADEIGRELLARDKERKARGGDNGD